MLLQCIAKCAYVTGQIEPLLRRAVGTGITNVLYQISDRFTNSLKMAEWCLNKLESQKFMLLCVLCVHLVGLVQENEFYTFVSPLRIELTLIIFKHPARIAQ
jgi:hypothetical protein